MPRIFIESRWLQKFTDLKFKSHVLSVCQSVWEKREIMPFPDVLRARIMMKALVSGGTVLEAKKLAGEFEVTPNCLWNYFTRNVEGWVERMEYRLGHKVERREDPPKRMHLSVEELQWIAKFLKTCTARTWMDKLRLLRGAAYQNPEFKRLSRLARSTLWGYREQLAIMDQCINKEREKCTRKRPRTSSPGRERDSMVFAPKQANLKPAAVVLPFDSGSEGEPDQVEGASQWTGNPF